MPTPPFALLDPDLCIHKKERERDHLLSFKVTYLVVGIRFNHESWSDLPIYLQTCVQIYLITTR